VRGIGATEEDILGHEPFVRERGERRLRQRKAELGRAPQKIKRGRPVLRGVDAFAGAQRHLMRDFSRGISHSGMLWCCNGSRYAAAPPLRKQPFFALRRRQSRMQGLPVGLPVWLHVPKEQTVAFAALIAPPKLGKVRLAAAIAVIEITEEREHALAEFGDLARIARRVGVEEIEVREELLADRVMQDGRPLE